jgi:competence protein ComEC
MNPRSEALTQAFWPGLLPWQRLFCAWVLGMLAWQWPVPAGTGLALFLFAVAGPPDFFGHGARPRVTPRATLGATPGARPGARPSTGPRLRPALEAVVLVMAFACGLGLIHIMHPRPPADIFAKANITHRHTVPVSAVVAEVRPRPGQRVQLILDDVTLHLSGGQEHELGGRLLWNWQAPPVVPLPGQRVHANVRIRPIQGMANPGLARSEAYYARQGIFHRTYARENNVLAKFGEQVPGAVSWPRRLGSRQRQELRASLLEVTPPGQGRAMLLALLMGDRYLLHQDTMDVIRRASLAHSMALSGMHLGFVVALGWLAARVLGRLAPGIYLRLPRPKLAVLLGIPLVLGYLWLGQAVPSLLRAALMFASWGLLLLLNRQRVLLDGLFLALLAILAFAPLSVFDLRLQLSALAVAGLALIWPLGREALQFARHCWWRKLLFAALGILAVSAVATLALLPLQAWFFGQISPHLYLNVLWLPLLGLVVFPLGLLGLVLLVVADVAPFAPSLVSNGAGMLLTAASLVLEAMLAGLHHLDTAGWLRVFIPARPLWPQFLGYWTLLLAAAAWWMHPARLRPAILAAGLVLLTAPLLLSLGAEQRNTVSLRLLDVSQGQAILLELPGGRRWLVDGGGFWTWEYDLGRNIITPILTHGRGPRLDGVVLTHADYDHYRGLYYPLRHFQVGTYASHGRHPTDLDGETLRRILDDGAMRQEVWRQGDVIDLGQDMALEVLHPDSRWLRAEKDNETSLVLRLTWKGRGLALMTGDLEQPGIAALLAGNTELRADVLVVPHHGSRSSHVPELYRRVQPALALISAGFLNRFNHPHPEVVEFLRQGGIPVLNTAHSGAVSIRWHDPSGPPQIRTERHAVQPE